ncbi:restriction endonuclease subunit S [Bradyrhizobium sp. Gha]|uniref:restriction endonuclease subunit S n=1 Tax=Bradyrhizobium sp. Gha TaxID=1855318 RepID=UPI0008F3F9E5|nr:restriction endonuclease subunit S [Bradyrhizobium sp. Gha]SFJ01858.1 type I restriction enzyme, S subunit [Bradyrhizobium sp. Gha]
MSALWPTKALREVCNIRPPKSEAKRKLTDGDRVSFVPMEDLCIGLKFLEPKAERKLAEVAGSYTYFADGDVLLAKITPCFENGKLGIAKGLTNGIGFGSSEYIVFRPTESLSSEYLYYFLSQDSFRAEGERTMSGAVGHKRVSKEFIENCRIPFPALREQHRIVAILDEAFAGLATAIANAERNLKNAGELFESYLNSVFTQKCAGWTTSELGKEVRFVDYRGKTPPKRETGIRLITAKNVKMNRVQRDPEEFIDPGVYDKWMTRGYPRRGDVLFTTEAPLGNVAQLDTDETVVIGQRLITMQPNDQVLDRTFLKYALMSRPTQAEILKRGTGATVVGIKASLLKQVPISFPPKIRDQQALANAMESTAHLAARLEETYRRKMNELIALKRSVLDKAFAGELTSPPSQALEEAAE